MLAVQTFNVLTHFGMNTETKVVQCRFKGSDLKRLQFADERGSSAVIIDAAKVVWHQVRAAPPNSSGRLLTRLMYLFILINLIEVQTVQVPIKFESHPRRLT